jgi:hypothetical protein
VYAAAPRAPSRALATWANYTKVVNQYIRSMFFITVDVLICGLIVLHMVMDIMHIDLKIKKK